MNIKFALAALAVALSAQPAMANTKFYVLGGAGKVSYDSPRDATYGMSLGAGAQISKHLSVETTYQYNGRFKSHEGADQLQIDAHSFSAGALLTVPIADKLSLLLRGDMVRTDGKASGTTAGAPFSTRVGDTSPAYGIGLEFRPVSDFAVRAQYQRVLFEDKKHLTADPKVNIDNVSLIAVKQL